MVKQEITSLDIGSSSNLTGIIRRRFDSYSLHTMPTQLNDRAQKNKGILKKILTAILSGVLRCWFDSNGRLLKKEEVKENGINESIKGTIK